MIASVKRLTAALVFALPVAALVMPPVPAFAKASSTAGVEQPTGTSTKSKKSSTKKGKSKSKTPSTTHG